MSWPAEHNDGRLPLGNLEELWTEGAWPWNKYMEYIICSGRLKDFRTVVPLWSELHRPCAYGRNSVWGKEKHLKGLQTRNK